MIVSIRQYHHHYSQKEWYCRIEISRWSMTLVVMMGLLWFVNCSNNSHTPYPRPLLFQTLSHYLAWRMLDPTPMEVRYVRVLERGDRAVIQLLLPSLHQLWKLIAHTSSTILSLLSYRLITNNNLVLPMHRQNCLARWQTLCLWFCHRGYGCSQGNWIGWFAEWCYSCSSCHCCVWSAFVKKREKRKRNMLSVRWEGRRERRERVHRR